MSQEELKIPNSTNQIFVRNLSYQTTQEDLEKCFQDFGPLKSCSIATQNGKSRGFGFVKFSLEDDAREALQVRQNYNLNGRRMKLEMVIKSMKKKLDESNDVAAFPKRDLLKDGKSLTLEEDFALSLSAKEIRNEDKIVIKSAESSSNLEELPSRISQSRQLVIFGVPPYVTKKAFLCFIQQLEGMRKALTTVELIKESHELSSILRLLMYPAGKVFLVTTATKATSHTLRALLNSCTLKSLHSQILTIDCKLGANADGKKSDRLFVRSLNELTPLWIQKRRCRVIVRNLSFEATERNVADKLGRFGPIIGIDIPKEPRVKRGNQLKEAHSTGINSLRPKGFAFVTFLCECDAEAAVEQSVGLGLKVCNREVAVDFCLNKDTYLKNETTSKVDDIDEVAFEEQEASSEATPKSFLLKEQGDYDDESTSSVKSPNAVKKHHGMEKETLPFVPQDDVSEGLTVFIRDLPFDCQTSDISAALSPYGQVAQVLIVKEKGSAFAKFKDHVAVDSCLSNSVVNLKGRSCRVTLAVNRETAQKLSQEQRAQDKRNIYLAAEGAKVEESDGDVEKRRRAQGEKRKKLQNPLFFVSGVRLSFHNLGRDVTDQKLRNAVIQALKVGLHDGIVTSKDMVAYIAAQGSTAAQAANLGIDPLQVPPFSPKTIRFLKVMREEGKGKGNLLPRSKGFGFVEFSCHAHALAVLREMDGNKRYSEIANGRPIVEFSIENIRKILEDRKKRILARNASVATQRSVDVESGVIAVQKETPVSKKRPSESEERNFKRQKSAEIVSNSKKADGQHTKKMTKRQRDIAKQRKRKIDKKRRE